MPMGHLDIPSTEILFSQTTLKCIKLTKTNQRNVYSGNCGIYSYVLGTFAHFLKVSALCFSSIGPYVFPWTTAYLCGILI